VAYRVARWVAALGLAELVALTSSAAASPEAASSIVTNADAPAGSSAASALIARGIRLRKSGDDRAALAAFAQAYAEAGSLQALAQMALAEQALGRWVLAHAHLEQALAAHTDPWIDAHRATLETAREEIASRLGQLEVSCNVAGALVEVDGEPIGRTPLPRAVPLVVGQSVLKISAPDHFAVTRQVQVDARALARVDVILTALPREGTTQPGTSGMRTSELGAGTSDGGARGGSARSVLMYSSLGLGALGLTVGVTGYVVREVNVNVYNDDSRCRVRAGIPRSLECKDQYDAWRLGQTLAIGGLAAAAVFGGVGLYLWLDRPAASRAQALRCSVGAGLASCSGRF
jgi:PEGA domain-containing protein